MKVQTFKTLSLGIAAVGAALAMGSCGGKQQAPAQQAPQVAVMTVETTSSDLNSSYPAIIKGKTDIDIRPQVTGFITKVHVDEGQRVRKGQTLFTIDQVQYQAAVEQAQAAVNSAQAAVNTAALTESNKRKLYDKNIISETEWQLAANSLAQAKAALAQAQSGLVNARKNLSYTVVTAPSDGVVGTIPNREGSLASPSSAQPLTTISDNSQVYAYFSLNEKDLLDLTDGGKYSVDARINEMPAVQLRLADGSIYPMEGKVSTVSGVINNATGAASVRALFPNPSGMLRSGGTGNVVIPQHNDSVIVIPQKASFEIQGLRYVYVLNDSNITQTRPVQVLDIDNGKEFVVLGGLQPGERIVTEGVGTIVRDGIPVQPKAAEAAAAPQQ
ncbi:MAG: efflux RND transporter periplasmic adaptor subunit [Muribaculaceae bacterium]|nr:efflux RND transporter periplasmic adaptor subunit [Muribaculaceae bacterium]MDE6540972.1 efflux RND transporter periplasmic adaptor subunit [Muribaculaceae bacterium]